MKISGLVSALLLPALLAPSLHAAPASGQLSSSVKAIVLPNVPVPSPVPSSKDLAARNLDGVFSLFGTEAVQEPLAADGNKGVKEAVYTLQLEPVRNAYLRTDAAFTAGRGTRVSLSVAKAANCTDGGTDCEGKEKAIIMLTLSTGQSFLIRGMDVANWSIFMSGSKTVSIDGENYKVKLFANVSSPEKSEIEVKGPGGRGLKVSLQALSAALVAKCQDVRLSKPYKLAYGNEVVQDGGTPRFTGKTQLIMYPFPITENYDHTVLKTESIKAGGTRFNFEPAYTFAINAGVLEISR